MNNSIDLYDQLCSFENLWMAWRKARKGKRKKEGSLQFEAHAEEELLRIQDSLKNETYQFLPYKTFTVFEPVERVIAAAPFRDRVVHHAIMNVLEPILEKKMISNSYACRKNKGTHKALRDVQELLKKSKWLIKLDIKKFFFTIDHQILIIQLKKIVTDSRMLILLEKLLQTYKSDEKYYFRQKDDNLFSILRNRGLPIGNLTSQWLANFYLTQLDQKIEMLPNRIGYVRYMDDMIVFGSSKEDVNDWLKHIRSYLEGMRLVPHPLKTQLFPVKNGVKFLGHHIWCDKRKVLRHNLQRFKKRMVKRKEAFEQNEIDRMQIALGLNGWLGFVEKEGKVITEIILEKIPFQTENGLPFRFTVLY